MCQYVSQILHSPPDLVRYLGCTHATALDLTRLRNPDSASAEAEDDAMGELVQQAGLCMRRITARNWRGRAVRYENGGRSPRLIWCNQAACSQPDLRFLKFPV